MGVLGEKLRQHRERRGLSLEAISSATKISPRMLSALEDEHFDQLPGGVFNKGFVRAYARVVGLDEDEALSDYLTALGENQIRSQTRAPNFRRETRPIPQSEPQPREKEGGRLARGNEDSIPPNAIASQVEDRRTQSDRRLQPRRSTERQIENPPPKSVSEPSYAVLLPPEPQAPESYASAAENYPVQYSEEEPLTPPPSFLNLSTPPQDYYEPESRQPNSTSPVRWQNLVIPLILLTLVLALWALHRRNTASSTEAAVSRAATSQTATTQSTTAQTATPQPATPSESLEASAAPSSSPTLATAAPIAKPAPVPSHPSTPSLATTTPSVNHSQPKAAKPKPLPTFTLVIRAAKTSWISITADGQPVAQETLIAPAHTSVHATQEIIVKTRNAGALSFTLNQLEIPPQGADGESRTYTFNASGLRTSSPSATAVR